MATIKDIAAKAAVSPGVVSRILNYDETLSVSPETKLKVLQAVEELEYIPIRDRRKIITDRSKPCIGIAEWYNNDKIIDDPYYLYLRDMIEKKAAEEEITIFRISKNETGYKNTAPFSLDGVFAIETVAPEEVKQLSELSSNIIFINSSPMEKEYDSVVLNFELGLNEALDHLVNLGHTKIGFIGKPDIISGKKRIQDPRKQILSKALHEYCLYDSAYFFDTVYYKNCAEEGYKTIKQAISGKKLPTAIMTLNDTVATGALRALLEENIRVPEDVSLIGFNNLPAIKYLMPALSSVHVHFDYIAECALTLFNERFAKNRTWPKKVMIPTNFIARNSTAAAKKQHQLK
ncbi:MAG: LacI family DNA-binding transcriptional regulator [Spirochaetes bacterium]|nr:LacI family DNA-binding transcriptional regulator [Spirochaetota bacterium]